MATIKIPPVLRPSTGGEKEITAAGGDVGTVLNALAEQHPSTKTPALRRGRRPQPVRQRLPQRRGRPGAPGSRDAGRRVRHARDPAGDGRRHPLARADQRQSCAGEPGLARRRDVQRAAVAAAAQPAALEHAIQQRGAEGARDVRAALGPVAARPHERAAALAERVHVDVERGEELVVAGEREGAVGRGERPAGDERVRQRGAEPAGEVVVAAARVPEGFAAVHGAEPDGGRRVGEPAERLERLGHVRPRQPDLALPPVRHDDTSRATSSLETCSLAVDGATPTRAASAPTGSGRPPSSSSRIRARVRSASSEATGASSDTPRSLSRRHIGHHRKLGKGQKVREGPGPLPNPRPPSSRSDLTFRSGPTFLGRTVADSMTAQAAAPAPPTSVAALRAVDRLALGAALVTVVLWASAFVGIRAASPDFSAGALALGRLLVGSVALGAILAIRREGMPGRAAWPAILVCGLLWFGVYNVALNEGERYVDAGTAAMLVNVGPILIAVLAGLVLHEGFPRALVLGCAVAFAGALVIGAATRSDDPTSTTGVLLCLLAAVAYAAAVVAQKPALAHASALQITFGSCLVGTIACLPFASQLVGEARTRRGRSALRGRSTSGCSRPRWRSRPGRTR